MRLCMLRNPWGSNEWTGEWSDASPLWTDELRRLHGCTVADDGTFHIPFDEYLKQYAWTSIAVDEDEHYSRFDYEKQFGPNNEFAYFIMDLPEPAMLQENKVDFAFSVSQQGPRL